MMVRLSCLWSGMIWQAAKLQNSESHNSTPSSLLLFYTKQSLSPPSLFCSVWAPYWTSSQKSALDSQLWEKQSPFPVPELWVSFRLVTPGLEGRERNTGLTGCMENSAILNVWTKNPEWPVHVHQKYVLLDIQTTSNSIQSWDTAEILLLRCKSDFQPEVTNHKPTFMAGGTKYICPVALWKTRMHVRTQHKNLPQGLFIRN